MSASVSEEDDTEIPWGPKGPKERTVINIRNYIYNKSLWESHSQREQRASCSLKVKIVSKISLFIFDYLESMKKSPKKSSQNLPY